MRRKGSLVLVVFTVVAMLVGLAHSGEAARRHRRHRRTSTVVKSTLRPVGSAILTDAQAASHVRLSSWEPRPGNTTQNHTVPTSSDLQNFHSYTGQWGGTCAAGFTGDSLRAKVTGHYTGTTDEI